jgi:hypothetical protein
MMPNIDPIMEEFDGCIINVSFEPFTNVENIESGEDISTMMSKISKWYDSFDPSAWTGHPTYTVTPTTSSITPDEGDTFTAVDALTIDNGHVTGYNTKTVQLPYSNIEDIEFNSTTNVLTITKHDGTEIEITISSGGGGGGGGNFTVDILWDYVTDNSGTIPYQHPFTKTLRDNINNYDAIQIECISSSNDTSDPSWNATSFSPIIPVYEINNSFKNNYFNWTSYDNRASAWYIKDTTIKKIANNSGNNTNGLVRVYGIRYNHTPLSVPQQSFMLLNGMFGIMGEATEV